MKHGFRRLERMEPPLEGRARQIIELADALQAKPLEQPRDVVGKSQGLDGKKSKRLSDFSLRDDDGRGMCEARQRMRTAQRFGEGKARAIANTREAHRHVGKERVGAAEKMRHAGNVEPQPIVAIEIEGRTVAVIPAG